MELNSASPFPSFSLLNSRVKVFPIIPLNLRTFSWSPLSFFSFLTILFLNISSTFSFIPVRNPDSESFYLKYCDHVVPKSAFGNFTPLTSVSSLRLKTAYFTGGDRIFSQTPNSASDDPSRLLFRPSSSQKTVSDGVYRVRGNLRLMGGHSLNSNSIHRRLRMVQFRGPRLLPRDSAIGFSLRGYWSESSGKLCMVGSGTSYLSSGNFRTLNVVLKLNYPKNAKITNNLITGTLISTDDDHSSNYFEPISILGISENTNYEYTMADREIDSGCLSTVGRGTKLPSDACSFLQRNDKFDLEYESDCENVKCNPLGRNIKSLPSSMFFHGIQCTEGPKLQMLLGFPNSSYDGFMFPFEPSSTLVAEGVWDDKDNRLCAVACRILNFTESLSDAFVGNCSIKFSLMFPAVLSLRNRGNVVGQIWSNETVNDSGYFGKIGFQGYQDMLVAPLKIKYNYTEVNARRSCAKVKVIRAKGKSYPVGSSSDMRFDMSVRNINGQVARGYSSPLFVGDQFYVDHFYGAVANFTKTGQSLSASELNNDQSRLLNISYKISFTPPSDFKIGKKRLLLTKNVEISAEGTYDMGTGVLCMTGCWHRGLMKNTSLDCEIVVNIQFPPLDVSGKDHVKGTIESKRLKSDLLYFDRLELSSDSIYTSQAKESIWRMDLELTMVLISNTLACMFVVLQLFYVKKQPNALSFISIVMVLVLTLGHMIPLLLNFEALFVANRNPQSVFLGSGGWLEVNEVIVRVVTMVAFLLELRLLQLTWSSRQESENQKGLWDAEKKVIYATLPLYVAGGFIAWFVHQWKNSHRTVYRDILHPHRKAYQLHPLPRFSPQKPFWEDLKSYAGLVLDGFLLPQILFNLICDTREKALSSSYYLGTTIVRLLPHTYDFYRARNSSWYLDLSYIYANHKLDFYSTAWDIIIPCAGLLFAFFVFLQQRYGGRCFLPKRFRIFRQSPDYEKVPIISNEEL